MAKYYGRIGYAADTTAVGPGSFDDEIVERYYYGEVLRSTLNQRLGDEILPHITIGNSISILADPYAFNNYQTMRYIEWNGSLWTIAQIEEARPRLIIRPGEVYNGPTV